jgi:succinyl-CoA synthetase beta subunit
MNLHEYQGKQLFAEYGLPVSKGYAVDTPKEATEAADMIGGDIWVVKAQVHAGGRGKAGGVKLVKSKEEIAAFAKQWLGNKLVTYQTDENGQPVSKILVESCTDIAEELYLGAVVDRSSRRIVFMASTEGGVEIEKVAEETPDKILRATIDPLVGAQPYQGRELAFNLGLKGDQIKQFVKIFMGLSQMFVEKDLALIEVNPLVITDQGNLHCLDAKIGVDGRPVGVELRGPGRQHRLHGQRCRPGHGHHGHCRPAWRLPRQLPRRGWRRHQGTGLRGLQNHPV